jgi:hypothetical protein
LRAFYYPSHKAIRGWRGEEGDSITLIEKGISHIAEDTDPEKGIIMATFDVGNFNPSALSLHFPR